MNKHEKISQSGFTLPEVIITSLLIMVLMVPLSRTAYLTIYSTRYARDVGTAMALGQQQLELFADMDYNSISSGSSHVDGFDLAWTVTSANNTKTVRMTVSWTILSKSQSVDLNTVYVQSSDRSYSLE